MLWENDAQGHRNARNDREFQGKTPSRHRILGREYLGNISFSYHLSLYFCYTEKTTRNDFIQPTEINKSLQQIPHPSGPRKCLNSIPYLIPFFSGQHRMSQSIQVFSLGTPDGKGAGRGSSKRKLGAGAWFPCPGSCWAAGFHSGSQSQPRSQPKISLN